MRLLAFACVVALLAACGGAQVGGGVDYRALLREGRAEDAVRALEKDLESRPDDPDLSRLLFLAHAAAWAQATPDGERPRLDADRRRRALDALDVAARKEGAGVALRRALADVPSTGLVRSRTGHVAVSTFALAWVTERFAPGLPSTPDEATRRGLVAAGTGLLELVAAAAEAGIADEEALRGPLDAGSGLLDAGARGLAFGGDSASAWSVYLASARTAVALSRADRPPVAAADVLLVAIVVVERNEGLALPVSCDLSSPLADLRRVAARDLALIRRLEAAVAPAHGCAPGTYAPVAE